MVKKKSVLTSEEDLSPSELSTLVRLAKKVMWSDRQLKQTLQEKGVHIIPARFYCEIPTVEEVESSFEYREIQEGSFKSDKVFRHDKLKSFSEELLQYAQEFNPPKDKPEGTEHRFFWNNPAFSYCDAMAYYCIIRMIKPRQILEIGSGFSTLVANEALSKNGSGKIILIEPYPMQFLKDLPTVDRIIESFVQDIPVPELLRIIEEGEIWFIDSTHTVKHGSDCLYIYLKVMPNVSSDILIHSHDIMLPFPLSKKRLIERNITWTEQYLLYAYLLDNPRTEVLFSSPYGSKFLIDELNALMSKKHPIGGGSIWYSLKSL